ncbi:MAG TPA: orotidine-5'-phosphate decarboxylase [Thermoplasmata archaeon]|nr:orotidine-5'-phosphate decarboxylase [Thermoplasmata archaeon]
MAERFQTRVDRILRGRNSLLCVGLDPDPATFPAPVKRMALSRRLPMFLDGIVAATRPYAAAYKMQLGAYLAFGPAGFVQMERVVRKIGPNHLRILDLKANDIPNTMRLIRDGAFGEFGFDALTVTPWLGWETLEPFQENPSKGVFVVAHSSNNGAPDFQEIPTPRGPLWLAVVGEVARLSALHGNAGAVVGATYIDAIRAARAQLGNEVPILVPGVGAQGGQLSATVREGVDGNGRGLLINSSRGIIFASNGKDWKKAAGAEAKRLMEQINQLRAGLGTRA